MVVQEQLEKLEVSEIATSSSATPVVSRLRSQTWLLPMVLPALCFLVAFAVSLVNNLFSAESKIVLIFDSRHYLESARLMVLWWQESLAKGDMFAALSNLVSSQKWFGEYLILDGPVLPTTAAIVFAAIGKVPQPTDWRVLIVVLSLMHATSSLLVCLLAKRWLNSANWGLIAGLSWALYPAAIVASSRFLTETPAVTLLLAGIWLLDKFIKEDKPARMTAVFLGMVDGLLLLLKPVLVPIWGLAHLIAWFACNWKKRVVLPTLVVAGIVAAFVPWLVTTKVVNGEFQLLPQRVPSYNTAKGCDVEVDGWSAQPSAPLTEIFAHEASPMAAISGVWTTRPQESLNLALRKVTRIWSWPWNDFRQHPLGLSMDVQRGWHWLFCLLSLGGAFVLLTAPKPINRTINFVGYASLAIVSAHLIYLPFETINRYGFTAMPFMVLLAVYFAHALVRMKKLPQAIFKLTIPAIAFCYLISNDYVSRLVAFGCDASTAHSLELFVTWLAACWLILAGFSLTASLTPKKKHATVILLTVLICIVSGAVLAGFAFDTKPLTWSCRLQPGQSACRTLDLDNAQLRSLKQPLGGALVLIDGDSSTSGAKVTVNGQVLSDKPVIIQQFRPQSYWVLDTMRKYAGTMGFKFDDWKQWYAVSVPVSCLHLSGGNVIVVSADKEPLTVYGEYSRGHEGQFPKDLDRFSAGLFCNDGELLDGRLQQPISKRFVPSVSSLEAGGFGNYDDLSPVEGKQTGEYHIYLAALFNPSATGGDAGRGASYTKDLRSADFDPLLRVPGEGANVIGISKAQFQCVAKNTVEVSVPQHVTQGSHLVVNIRGKMRSHTKKSLFSLLPVAVGGKNNAFTMVLPHAPASIGATTDWQDFAIVEEIPIAAMQGAITKLHLGIYPGPWEQVSEYGVVGSYGQTLLKDLSVNFTANYRKTFSGKVNAIF